MFGFGLSPVWMGRNAPAMAQLPPGAVLVFALLGQSNMVGRAVFDGGPVHPAGTQQWGRNGADDGTLVPASVPLQHHDANAGQMGLDITFAEDIAAAFPGHQIVLVPSAAGGSGFSDNRWNPGDDLYLDAVARTNAVMAANPDFVLAGFLWHQGEKDVGFAGYQAALETMIAGLRQDVAAAGPATPFVLGGLVPGWVAGNPARQATQDIIDAVPGRVAASAVASAEGLTGAGSDVHFTAADLRGLGSRYATAWAALFAGLVPPTALGTLPDQSDTLGGSGSGVPAIAAPIPDQTDPVAVTAPAAIGTIPDQQDVQA